MSPQVSCIVLNFNGKDLICEALDSLQRMTYPNFNIIVVDNGSVDKSQEIVRGQYPSLTLIENSRNLGFGEGNNVGIRYALEHQSEWMFLLNNDIVVHPELLSGMMRVAMTDEHIGLLAPKIYDHSRPDVIWYAGGKVNFWTGTISHVGLRETDHGQYDRVQDTEYITGCAMLIRRSVVERAGMFDPIYSPAYTEDADLSARAERYGYRLVYVPDGKLWHKVSSSSGGGLTPFKTQLKVEHNLIFFKRYARWYHWLTIPWFVGFGALVFILKELSKGNFKILAALARGFLQALKHLK